MTDEADKYDFIIHSNKNINCVLVQAAIGVSERRKSFVSDGSSSSLATLKKNSMQFKPVLVLTILT